VEGAEQPAPAVGTTLVRLVLLIVYLHPVACVFDINLSLSAQIINTSVFASIRSPPLDVALQPFFMVVQTTSKNSRAKRGDMNTANACITTTLSGMDTWITKSNWEHGFGGIFLGFREAMQKYYLRLNGQVIR
jgi:hypothetical protein